MKVLNRTEFLKLPSGTFYAKGKPWYFDGVSVKHDTTASGNDWWALHFCWPDTETGDLGECVDVLEKSLTDGSSFPMQTAIDRDGCNDSDQLFLVFEKDDLVSLRTMIDKAILGCGA